MRWPPTAPHIELLKALLVDMRFVLGAKPGDHEFLFQWVETTPGTRRFETTDTDGTVYRFRYLNDAPLNDAHFQLQVNFLEYWAFKPNAKPRHFSWVTDLPITDSNAMTLMRARARPLAHRERDLQYPEEPRLRLRAQLRPRQGPTGDGDRPPDDAGLPHRPSAQRCCSLFQAAKAKAERARYLWQKPRALFFDFELPDWETLYRAIACGFRGTLQLYRHLVHGPAAAECATSRLRFRPKQLATQRMRGIRAGRDTASPSSEPPESHPQTTALTPAQPDQPNTNARQRRIAD